MIICRTARGSFALLLGAPGQLQSLAGLDHDRTVPLADISCATGFLTQYELVNLLQLGAHRWPRIT
jgi:hypothetical protein